MSKKSRGTLNPAIVKMIFLGLEGVGKSAMMVRFLTRRFIGEYDPDLETTHRRHLPIGNTTLALDLKDTAGENDAITREQDFSNGDIFVLVYSVTDEKSFKEIQHIYKLINLCRNQPTFVIIANKADLEHLRVITQARGQNLADKYQCPYHEVSVAEDYIGTHRIFNDIIKYVVTKKASEETVSSKKRSNSFTNVLKSFEKQHKISKDRREDRYEIFDILRGVYNST